MKTKTLIQQLIREIISEAAITPSAAAQQGLGLVTFEDGDLTTYVLYHVKKLEKLINDQKTDNVMSDDDVVYGTLTIKEPPSDQPSWGSKVIVSSAAEKGYGPMLYDIVMSDQGGLVADREKVSPQAKRVWDVYHDRSDVKHLPLDDYQNPKTKEKVDDAELHAGGDKNSLNYAYKAKNKVSYDGLNKNHVELMKRLGSRAKVAHRYLDVASFSYFQDRYHSR